MSAWKNLTGTIFAVTIGLVAVFMVVGGIVIMNIMLASVTERTHEIGIRKSLGARRRDILWQFVFESGMMASMGGIAGVPSPSLVARVVNMFFTAEIPIVAVVVGVTLSAAVGLFFGIYPAKKAARLDPIEALRIGELKSHDASLPATRSRKSAAGDGYAAHAQVPLVPHRAGRADRYHHGDRRDFHHRRTRQTTGGRRGAVRYAHACGSTSCRWALPTP